VLMADVARSGAAAMSQEKIVQPEPLSAQAVVFATRPMEKDAPEVLLVDMVMGQASMSMPPAPIARGAILEEVPPLEGSVRSHPGTRGKDLRSSGLTGGTRERRSSPSMMSWRTTNGEHLHGGWDRGLGPDHRIELAA
jgi:hypothetical protein